MTHSNHPTSVPEQVRRRRLGQIGSLLVVGAMLLAAVQWLPNAAAEKAVVLPAPSADIGGASVPAGSVDTIVFAGGCFWGIQAVFQHTQGVLGAVSGYAGGRKADATYEQVSTGSTGHAEAVQVRYDPRVISYGRLLQIYFSVAHDPTQLNRQFPDSGPQYRSAVFYKDESQKQSTARYIAQLDAAHVFPSKIVTTLTPLDEFYPAERYHQNYATLHPGSPYIARFDLPKLVQLKALYPAVYREQPVLVEN